MESELDQTTDRLYQRGVKSGDIIKKLRKAGWEIARVSGDHHTMAHPDNPLIVTVTHPRKDVSIGQIKDIERKSGVKLR